MTLYFVSVIYIKALKIIRVRVNKKCVLHSSIVITVVDELLDHGKHCSNDFLSMVSEGQPTYSYAEVTVILYALT